LNNLELPKAKVKASKKNPKILILYGSPKVGKTTLLSQLDNCLIIDLENGSNHVDALKINASNPEELYKIAQKIKESGKPYKYVAIDTITKLEEWCEELATKKYKESPIGKNFQGVSVLELPMGAGYKWLRNSFSQWTDLLSDLAENVIFIGHLKDKFIVDKSGKDVAAKDLQLTGKIRDITCANADAIGYVYRFKNDIWVSFKSQDDVVCGARPDHLKGENFVFNWNKIYIDEN